MLREPKNDLVHLLGILESAAKITEYADGFCTSEDFLIANNEMNFNACLTLLAVIGESIGKLSDHAGSALADLPLRRIKGMRNRIVHDYIGVDSQIVFDTITLDLGIVKSKVNDYLIKQIQSSIFDSQEVIIARESNFYSCVTF